jgi:MYXO-CTERM domain-containing protein
MRFGAVAGIAVLGLVAAAAIRSEWFSAKRGEPEGPRDTKLVNLPLRFEPNLGQLGARTAFVARTPGFSMLLDARGMNFELASKGGGPPERVSIGVVGARDAHIAGEEELTSKSHYLLGSSPANWRVNVPNYRRARYEQILPGVDLVVHGAEGEVEYDFVVSPGFSPEAIMLEVDAEGKVAISKDGDLAIETSHGILFQRAPKVYQQRGGVRVPIEAHYRLVDKRRVAFAVGALDRTLPLVIDPVVSYATYLGGNGSDSINAVAVDANGAIYLAGQTSSTNLPAHGAEQPTFGGGRRDAFLAKLDHDHSLVYATYLGGSGEDVAISIAPLDDGSIAVVGRTDSGDFPTSIGAPQRKLGGGTDGFAVHLGANGASFEFASYFGGSSDDEAMSVAVDSQGAIYFGGNTESVDLPVAHALYATRAGSSDGFLAKVAPEGGLAFATYFGGASADTGGGVAVSPLGWVALVGSTNSSDLPLRDALQTTPRTYRADAFVALFGADGQSLRYATYFGGSGSDGANGVAFDSAGRIYVAGGTDSADFPVKAASQPSFAGGQDVFLARLSSSGSSVEYATYLGGDSIDGVYGLSVLGDGRAFVGGTTMSSEFPTRAAVQNSLQGVGSAFASAYDATGALVWSTYFGRTSLGSAIAAVPTGDVYLAGTMDAPGFATPGALQPAPAAGGDGFLVKLSPGIPDGGASDSGTSGSDASADTGAADADASVDSGRFGRDASADAGPPGSDASADGSQPMEADAAGDGSDAAPGIDARSEGGNSADGSRSEDGASADRDGSVDAAVAADGSPSESIGSAGGEAGCSCRTGSGQGGGLAPWSLGLLVLVRRRPSGKRPRLGSST